MFLQKILSRNEKLIETVVDLHQGGYIPPNSYILDVDTIGENLSFLIEGAKENHLALYPMTKQIGRNPVIIRMMRDAGVPGCVCVDMADARKVFSESMKIGHIGHLVQVPFSDTAEAVAMKPEYWTVFSLAKAEAISNALPPNTYQKILLRIYSPEDTFYTGHEGGVPANEILKYAKAIDNLPGLKFAGLTSFPTQLFSIEENSIQHTANYHTLFEAKKLLEANGYHNIEINAPGTTSSHLFAEMSASGVTQVEPGHGLTGTTPMHAIKDLVEKPAMAYLSEVSHFYKNDAYCFGGGLYIDPVFPSYDVKACVGSDPDKAKSNLVHCDIPDPASIDYYGIMKDAKSQNVQEGDTVIFGFRAQAFVTRAYVVPVAGISTGNPKVLAVFDVYGNETGW